jgi:hypothetical protein
MSNRGWIAFIGDSFCAGINKQHGYNGLAEGRGYYDSAAFPSLVADHYDYNLAAHGYGGKSWWYSRSQFLKQYKNNAELQKNLKAIVFCHTDWARVNTWNPMASTANKFSRPSWNPFKNDNERFVAKAQQAFQKYLYDNDFQQWAMINWFREISREFQHVKQIHFHGFSYTTEFNHLLTGCRFNTPLIHISIGELSGNTADIEQKLMYDQRVNHLNDKNNKILAEIIIESMDNFQDQILDIDMSRFEAIVNPNSTEWPNGNYGTQQ